MRIEEEDRAESGVDDEKVNFEQNTQQRNERANDGKRASIYYDVCTKEGRVKNIPIRRDLRDNVDIGRSSGLKITKIYGRRI